MPHYGLGIDAGGTYTDTAIVDLDSGAVLSGNKALTTREDLSAGIRNSLAGLDRNLLNQVSLTSLSSTLATNSVVEGKGCKVGLICIGTGYSESQAEQYTQISGKFNFSGKEIIPLDMDEVESALKSMKDKVDALAISGYVSVRNPAHETAVKDSAKNILGIPTVCAHDLTSKLGFEQRTVTAVMNARLIPVIRELLESVKMVLSEFNIESPLMVVKGDGSLMKSDVALSRPVETILSGPASSIMGAKTLTRTNDAMIIDMGGTTSDIGILKNGLPRLEPEGASIAGKRTRVLAADISTFGIGGDSRIVVNGKDIILSPVRAIPLCIAASRWPSIKEDVSKLIGVTDDRSAESYKLEEMVQDTEFFTLAHTGARENLTDADKRLLELLKEKPRRLKDAASILGIAIHSFSVAEMEGRDIITRIGVTPTDILHAEGSYSEYDAYVSKVAVEYLARKCSKTPQAFIDDTKDIIVRKIASSAIEKAITDESGSSALTASEKEFIDRITNSEPSNYSFGFTLKMPIIGIGAPVDAWIPKVADMLNTRVILPENSNIGNAIGAITGSVSEKCSIVIRANTDELLEEPECTVFTKDGSSVFSNPGEALEFARARSSDYAVDAARRSGASHPVVEVDVEESYCELCNEKRYFRGATVTATATGKPDLY